MKKLITGATALFISFASILAQNIVQEDMLRTSQLYPWGTARAMGMGSAFGALGGDQTSASLNPAGLGVYRSSEFTFTPSVSYNTTLSTLPDSASTDHMPHTSSDYAMKFNIQNIGYVYTYNSNKEEGWVSASFGISYNRLADFNRNVLIKTPHAFSSLLDEFTYYANDRGRGPLPTSQLYEYYEGLAYQTYALDNQLNGNWWHSDYSFDHQYGQQQMKIREITGGIGEYDFAFGANYSNKLYLGMTVGIQSLNYKENTRHTETDVNGSVPNLKSFDFNTYYKLYGVGYNLKFGVILRPVNMIRLGFALHSPTFYNIDSEFNTSMQSNYDGPVANGRDQDFKETAVRINKNELSTPWKYIGSAALQFGQFGMLSADYEYLDYSDMKLRGDISADSDPNDNLNMSYKSVHNLRIGGETKIGPLALRAGYGIYGSPYKGELNFIDYTSYTGGIGFRGNSFFIDLAYVFLKYSDRHSLYNYIEDETSTDKQVWYYSPTVADSKNETNKFVLTLGFRF